MAKGDRRGKAPDENDDVQLTVIAKLTAEQRALVAQHMGLVGVHLKNRVPTPWRPNRHREYEDLFQEGCVGLIRAAARYRPHRDGVFAAYALPRIRAAIHHAIFSRFTVVPIPARALHKALEQASDPKTRPPYHVQEITTELEKAMIVYPQRTRADDSIRHAIRRRYEWAVRRALDQMRAKQWRYRNPCEIMARIARERLLIDDEGERTPLRRIAREAGVSCGRVNDYEKHLSKAVAGILRDDAQVQALVEMSREEPAGLDAPLDDARRERLRQAEVHAFATRFESMTAPARAEVIYSLIERSAQSLPEVARNLFRLTLGSDDELRTVA